MDKKFFLVIILSSFLFGCSTYNQPKPDYNNKEVVQDNKQKASESYQSSAVKKKEEEKEADYNDILNRYQLPSDSGRVRKDNENLSVGEKQTIKINVQ